MQISLRGIEISLPTDATHIYVAERLSFISSNKFFIRHIYFPSYSFYIPLFDLKKHAELSYITGFFFFTQVCASQRI